MLVDIVHAGGIHKQEGYLATHAHDTLLTKWYDSRVDRAADGFKCACKHLDPTHRQ